MLYKIKGNRFYISDPAKGLDIVKEIEFVEKWISSKADGVPTGIVLTLEPTPAFYNNAYNSDYYQSDKKGFSNIFPYLHPYKKLIIQLILGMLLGSLLQLILPFLSQAVIDTGINTGNIHFITHL